MLSLSIDGPVATITLCRPPVNAISEEWIARLGALLDEIEDAGTATVLRIRSSERVFCAGADLAFMRARFETAQGRAEMIVLTRAMQDVYARLERMRQVSVAQIGGAALGGGLELALACDLRVAADEVRIGLPEARLGLLPAAGGTQRLTRLCGGAIARRLILGAEVVTGTDAVALGLAQWSAPAAALEATVDALVERLAALPADAIARCKACIAIAEEGTGDGFAAELAASAALLASPDTQRRVRDFLAKKS